MGLFGSAPKPPTPQVMKEWKPTARAAGALSTSVLNTPIGTYGGDWVADMTGGQGQAIDAITQRGLGGNPLLGQSQGYASDVLSGRYLDQENPYLQKSVARMTDMLGRQIGGQFAGSGMEGSPAHLQYLTEAFSSAAAPLMMQNYQQERANQSQMAGLAPDLANADFFGLNQALGAQQLLQGQRQAEIDADRARYDAQQTERMRRLQGVMGAVGPQLQPQTMPGTPGSTGLLPGMLSGGTNGAMMGGAAGGGWGAVGGGLLGALAGGFANR